jgi:uncharacterized membrane protein
MIERFARIQREQRYPGTNLAQCELAHCRSVTRVWSGFFLFNGLVAGLLAVFAPIA